MTREELHALRHQLEQDLSQEVLHAGIVADAVICGSMGSSMIFTDEGWQEVKVGRVFSSLSRQPAGQKGDQAIRFKLTSRPVALIWVVIRSLSLSLKPA